jgi:hypothetical protein
MKTNANPSLFASAVTIILIGIVTALLAAQWKVATLPLPVLALLLALGAFKSRLIVLDFIGMRSRRTPLVYPLYGWIAFVLVLAAAKVTLAG